MLGIGSSPTVAAVNSEGWRQAGELALAFGLSAVIGLEREIRQKNAGLRTQILVGVGAALFMLISKYGFTDVQARGVGRFRLCYRRLVATNSAVITVADEPNQLSGLRRELIVLLRVAGGASAGDLVHITLFRYATPLRDPASLLNQLAATDFQLDIDVSELLVIRERIFPSLDYQSLHRLPLPPATPTQHAAANPRPTA